MTCFECVFLGIAICMVCMAVCSQIRHVLFLRDIERRGAELAEQLREQMPTEED